MSELTQEELNELIECVKEDVYDRFVGLTEANELGIDEDDLLRVKVENGSLCFWVDNVHVVERMEQEGIMRWYVSATLKFQAKSGETVQGTTDIYQCYKSGDMWVIDWHSS